ncbi:MAG: response regulator [Acidobacteriota bacterium]|nr:response regulator [Acidobacteriota bacterium]
MPATRENAPVALRPSSRRRKAEQRRRAHLDRALRVLTDPALSTLPGDQLPAELLTRLRAAVGGEVAAVLLASSDGRSLRVTAVDGDRVLLPGGKLVAMGEGPIGIPVQRGRTAVYRDTAELAGGDPDQLRSLAVAAVPVGEATGGGVVVGSRAAGAFEEDIGPLLEVVADRCGRSVHETRLGEAERRNRLAYEHARLHLGLLARAGLVLSKAMESYDEPLVSLGEVLVPAFADWFCVDLIDEVGQLRRVVSSSRDERGMPVAWTSGIHRHPEGDEIVRAAMASGRSRSVMPYREGPMHGGEPARPGEEPVESDPEAGVESMLVVPIRVRGLSFGALSLVTEKGRRGYRRSDLETAEDLADRIGVTVERVLSWRESRAAEAAARLHATRLQALMEASLVINSPLAEPEVMDVLVDHARRVVLAEEILVCSVGEAAETSPEQDVGVERQWSRAGRETAAPGATIAFAARAAARLGHLTRAGAPPGGTAAGTSLETPWIAVPMAEGRRPDQRVLVVVGVPGQPFTEDDESVTALLAQMASVALQNAHLYDVVRGSEHRLRAIVDSSPLAIAEVDLEGAARWWNRAATELFGWRHQDPAEKRLPVRERAAGLLVGLWDRSRRGEATVGTELGATSPDGGQLELSVSTAPLRAPDGAVGSVLVVAEDVTERRRMLDRFHQAERLTAMARMAGGLAHDFNNLLTIILGCSEVLTRQMDAESPMTQEVAAIQRAGQRAAALTGQLLTIGRRQGGQRSVVDLDEILCAMEPMLVGLLGEDVELDISPGTGGACVLVDPGELERVVINLAINARDAMAEGGRLGLRSRTVSASGRETGGLVALSVSDTGVGMDVETQEHCFEPFFTTKGLARGTGLGLAVVHAMVSQAGGQVLVDSVPGRGTTFTLWFPVAEREPGRPAPATEADDGERRVLLFVEDEPELRQLSVRELERQGFAVVPASSGVEALRALDARQGLVDLVVTDVLMPGMSGLELRRVIRDVYPAMPVLLISGNLDDSVDDETTAEEPTPDLLAKPFTPDQLAARVRQLLGQRQRDETGA